MTTARVAAFCAAGILLTVLALDGATLLSAHEPANDKAQIAALIGATWDKPDAKVHVDPVVIAGDHAIAGWTQGDRGGRALLRRKDEKWSVVLCSGDPLKSAEALQQAGVPKSDASRLSSELAQAETAIDPRRRAQFSSFEGTVAVDDPEHINQGTHLKH